MIKRILLCASLMTCSLVSRAQLMINEIMQSNIDCIMDDLNEFPDSWVEIYKAGNSSVTLANYKIGLTDDASAAWQLPSNSIGAHGYALVYCDKEATGMHTNFRLDSGKGGSVYLFHNSVVEDKLENIAKQPAPNISYGRETTGSSTWGWQSISTPKSGNYGTLCTKILGEPVFSIPGQVFTGSSSHAYSVTMTVPEGSPEGTYIKYTIDGSEPTTSNGIKYTTAYSSSTTRVIRAKLFCDGYLSPRSTTQSYIVLPRQMTLPVVSIVTNNTYFYDDTKGIYVDGTYNSSTKNYEYDWRRPINFEYFVESGSESVLNQLCETRVCGAASRGCTLKSLAIYANKRFGEKHFKYEFFPEDRPGLKKYTSLVLRNAGNDFDYLYMRDAVAQRAMAKYQDIDWQAWQPAIVYINGTYKGMLNIRERGNEDNIYTNYDGLEDIDLLENWGVKEGDDVNKNAFQTFYTDHNSTYEDYQKWMDVEEFVNYYIMQSYFNNIDFPANNCMMWRPRTDDGKWRWIAKDVDYIMGLYNQQAYNYKYLNWLNNNDFDSSYKWGNTWDGTRLFRRIEEKAEFKKLFIERFAIYMGDFLNYDNIWENIWSPMYEKIKTEYTVHRKLINEWWPTYSNELSKAQTWLKSRTNFMYQHIEDYYESSNTPITMTLNADGWTDSQKEAVDITFNGVTLSRGVFNGMFYKNHTITLQGVSKLPGINVTGWTVMKITNSGGAQQSTVGGSTLTIPVDGTISRLVITANTGFSAASEIEDVTVDGEEEPLDIYDISGVRHATMQKGINIIRMKDGSVKKILSK